MYIKCKDAVCDGDLNLGRFIMVSISAGSKPIACFFCIKCRRLYTWRGDLLCDDSGNTAFLYEDHCILKDPSYNIVQVTPLPKP